MLTNEREGEKKTNREYIRMKKQLQEREQPEREQYNDVKIVVDEVTKEERHDERQYQEEDGQDKKELHRRGTRERG